MAEVAECRRMLEGVLAASHMTGLEQLPDYVAEHAARAGLHQAQIYLADLQQDVLFLLTGRGHDAHQDTAEQPGRLCVEGTLAGRAYQHGQILRETDSSSDQATRHWWVPLRHGAERLGVLRLTSANANGQAREDMQSLADLVGLIVVSKRALSDSYARLVRTGPMNVAAEMQWHLMPPLTFANDRVVLGAALEPAYGISGDAFDYAIAGRHVHIGIFDAMGHDTPAGITANLAVAACRNSRRQGAGLIATTEHIEKVLIEQFRGLRYTTGLLADLDTDTGVLRWVNRGHHPPVLVHPDRRITRLTCDPGPPMGTGLGLESAVCTAHLSPGDRVVVFTDGFTEARGPSGQEFGLDRFVDFITAYLAEELSVPETLRRLVHSIVEYHHGRLSDDATVLMMHWHGPTPFDPGEAEALVGLYGQEPETTP